MKKVFILFILEFCFVFNSCAQQAVSVIPYPLMVTKNRGSFCLKNNPYFQCRNTKYVDVLGFLNNKFNNVGADKRSPVYIQLKISPIKIEADYILNTNGTFISIVANDKEGLFHGMITLLQLIQTGNKVGDSTLIPRVVITDKPRYTWRGFLLDESRHFFGKAEVEKLLDWMAYYKLNRFHWHLTDANGWRIQIKQYPLLTTIGGKGDLAGSSAQAQYYTQDDIRAIVKYAGERYITIIPEIDMPGHATAALKAYPQFSGGSVNGYPNFTFNPGSDATYVFLTNILKEIASVFPSQIIHLGGDEVAFGIKAWDTNADVKLLMDKEHLPDMQAVEKYFIRRIADSAARFSNIQMCWDESAQSGLNNKHTIINWWRHNKPEALKDALSAGYKVVLSPRLPLYFDFVQDSTHVSGRRWDSQFCSLWDVYHFPDNSPDKSLFNDTNIIGLQANLWTETVITAKRLNYLIFPRMAALAEAGWTVEPQKDERSFKQRLLLNFPLYNKAGIYYYDPFNPKLNPEPIDINAYKAKAD